MKLVGVPKIMKPKAILSSGITVVGLSEVRKDVLKEKLTFKNPLYASVKKYSKWSHTNVPPFLYYYHEKDGLFHVPIGCDCLDDLIVHDERVFEEVEYPKFVLKLRGDQEKAFNSYVESNQGARLNGCIQMPTGKGKSILGMKIASHYSCRTLVIVHKDDLVTGWLKDIDLAFGGKMSIGIIKAKRREIGEQITIATIQTLNRLTADELEELYDTFGLVIQDEMHHCPATSFALASNFRARYKLGLTATPERSDGLTHVMSLYYGGFAYKYEHTAGDKDILPVQVITRRLPIKIDPICRRITREGRVTYVLDTLYTERPMMSMGQILYSDITRFSDRPQLQFAQLDRVATHLAINAVISDVLKEYQKGRSCLVFYTLKESCLELYNELINFVGEENVSLYYGDNKKNEEVLTLTEEKRKHITITTYKKATEGTNVKQWEVAFLVSSMNDPKNVEQAVGRIRRAKGGKINPVLVYDYRYDNVVLLSRHGATRDLRYRTLYCTFADEYSPRKAFTRGFH